MSGKVSYPESDQLTKANSNPPLARLVLAYKNIPYETVWLEHKDIEPTLQSMYTALTHLIPQKHH